MKALKKSLLTSVCLLLTSPVFAAAPAHISASQARPDSVVASLTVADRYALRCKGQAPQRTDKIQGTELWGTKRAWDVEQKTDERNSVLTFIDGDAVRKAPDDVKAVRVREGRLHAWPDASSNVVGMVLQGADSDGNPVEVAICGAEPSADDPSVEWYRIEAWNPVAQEWENPCQSKGGAQTPRAMAVGGIWDTRGAHQDAPGKVTLACELGAISKCINWGYKPWGERDGKSLAGMHQACTRMARADYCGNGRSRTLNGTVIDMYDSFGMQTRMTKASSSWDPALASFEAAWGPDGATCMARTRYGEPLETILQECPGRFSTGAVDLGGEDRCTVRREGMSPETVLLRNRSYDGH
ncbi:ADYC domain-containing protein [Pyxidicoccus sp. MSG2]|uniref:ADYC domain-containing protein n=1 Tax=Pyxidicoccus sp. MSG2 TaxID=2996790 RepID=UPI00226DB813|nr:ADYC domain-containing protein [Pyxidicoccus sp. MSG2]MCY1019474.1 ADYC domain-containing protein [Pyxidicoccus sp. MSG2]